MAPECLAGQSSPHSDQFSLAISYVELRIGKLPFEDESISQVIEERRKGQLNLEGLSPAEERVIRRACAVNPDKRFGSSVELIEALRTAVLDTPATSKSFNWLALTSLAALCLAAGIAVWAIYDPHTTPDIDLPPTKTGKQYFAEAMAVLRTPQLSPAQLAEATNLYLSALANDFVAEVPAPRRMGIQDDSLREQVYPIVNRRRLSQLVAIHPQTKRTIVLGDDGRSLIELTKDLQDTRLPFELEVPVASVHWLDQSHLLIRDLQTNLWRLNLESQTKEQIATGVLRVVSSPLSEMALSASDDDGTGTSALLQVRATDTLPLPLPPNRSTMITPLLGIDSAGMWGAVFEEIEKAGTGLLFHLDAAHATPAIQIDSEVEPFCCTCLRLGTECFTIVGGKSQDHSSGLAFLRPQTDSNTASVTFPVVAAEQNFFEGSDRFVRTLATHVSADDSGALLAAGQDVSVGSPATQLWKIQPNGTASYQSIVGQETQGPSISALAFDASGEWLVRGTSWGEVRLTKLSDTQLDLHLMSEEYQDEVIQIQIVGGKIIAAFADATILIWDFYECQMVYDAHVSKNQPLPQIVHARSQAG
jgi:hypothetical protein